MVFPLNVKVLGHFLNAQLTKTLPRLYETNYTQLWGLNPAQNFHNAIGDLPLGMDTIEAYFKSDYGQIAALYDGNGDDIPIVDLALGTKNVPCAMFVQGCNWNLIQIEKFRVAQASGQSMPTINIVAAKQDLMADYFNRREHYVVLYGYPKVGIRGIFSLQNIAKSDTTFVPYKKTAGAYDISTEQLYIDLTDLIMAFVSRARLSSPAQVRMKIPPVLGRRLLEIFKVTTGGVTSYTGLTLKMMLQSQELGLGVASIEVHNELQGVELNKFVWNDTATAMYPTSTDRIVFQATTYRPERHFYARRPFAPFQRSTLEFEQILLGSTSGIINFEDEMMWYYDFSNATS